MDYVTENVGYVGDMPGVHDEPLPVPGYAARELGLGELRTEAFERNTASLFEWIGICLCDI